MAYVAKFKHELKNFSIKYRFFRVKLYNYKSNNYPVTNSDLQGTKLNPICIIFIVIILLIILNMPNLKYMLMILIFTLYA